MVEALQLWASAVIVAAILVLFCDLAFALRDAVVRVLQDPRRRLRGSSSSQSSKGVHVTARGGSDD